jgi:hypothetical protein
VTTPITIPGTIPNLLRVGAIVYIPSGQCVVTELRHKLTDPGHVGIVVVADTVARTVHRADPRNVMVDLSDPTSRIHAAWWVIERGPVTEEEHIVLLVVKQGGHVNCKGQEQLRDMVLRRYNRSQT